MKEPEDSVFQEAMDGVAPLKEGVHKASPRPESAENTFFFFSFSEHGLQSGCPQAVNSVVSSKHTQQCSKVAIETLNNIKQLFQGKKIIKFLVKKKFSFKCIFLFLHTFLGQRNGFGGEQHPDKRPDTQAN